MGPKFWSPFSLPGDSGGSSIYQVNFRCLSLQRQQKIINILNVAYCKLADLRKITVICISATYLCLLFCQIRHDKVEEWIWQGGWCSSCGAEHKPTWTFLSAQLLPQREYRWVEACLHKPAPYCSCCSRHKLLFKNLLRAYSISSKLNIPPTFVVSTQTYLVLCISPSLGCTLLLNKGDHEK